MGAPKKRDWRAERRKRAWDLYQQGWIQKQIAIALGVSASAISQWMKKAQQGGEEALASHPAPGVSPRLSAEQFAHLPALLARGAESFGFRGNVWTANRIAQIIYRVYGVHYHRDHVSRLLRRLGWSRQQPETHATQRNGEAIQEWYEQRWPLIKKKGMTKNARSSGWMNRAFIFCL